MGADADGGGGAGPVRASARALFHGGDHGPAQQLQETASRIGLLRVTCGPIDEREIRADDQFCAESHHIGYGSPIGNWSGPICLARPYWRALSRYGDDAGSRGGCARAEVALVGLALLAPGLPDPANLLSPADNPRRGRSHGQLAEFGTNPISGGMTEVIEDAQGLLPGVASLLPMVAGEVGVAEVGEGVGLAEAVSEVAEDGQSVLVASHGFGHVA